MNSVLDHPIIWIPAIGFFLALVVFFGARKTRGGARIGLAITGTVLVLLPTWLLVAAFAPAWIDARHRTYQAFYKAIQPGMTRFEVLASLERHYPADGPRQRPKIVGDTEVELGFLMQWEQSSGTTADGISVILANGKVVRKDFSPD